MKRTTRHVRGDVLDLFVSKKSHFDVDILFCKNLLQSLHYIHHLTHLILGFHLAFLHLKCLKCPLKAPRSLFKRCLTLTSTHGAKETGRLILRVAKNKRAKNEGSVTVSPSVP